MGHAVQPTPTPPNMAIMVTILMRRDTEQRLIRMEGITVPWPVFLLPATKDLAQESTAITLMFGIPWTLQLLAQTIILRVKPAVCCQTTPLHAVLLTPTNLNMATLVVMITKSTCNSKFCL